MPSDLFALLAFMAAVGFLPVAIAIYRDKPLASWVMILAWAIGVPVIGWFVGLYLALED